MPPGQLLVLAGKQDSSSEDGSSIQHTLTLAKLTCTYYSHPQCSSERDDSLVNNPEEHPQVPLRLLSILKHHFPRIARS